MFQKKSDPHNILSYQGPFNMKLISFMGTHLKKVLICSNGTMSRVFKVFVELTQNVANYSAERKTIQEEIDSGMGWFTVFDIKGMYRVTTGNLIYKEHGPILTENCTEINNLAQSDLRKLKRYTRMQSDVKDIGAHIGLIQTGMIAENPLNYTITEINKNYSFFTISVDILKTPIDNLKSN